MNNLLHNPETVNPSADSTTPPRTIANLCEDATTNGHADGAYNMLQTALWYARGGWHVFPCVPGDKKPITEHGLKDATRDIAIITNWWTRTPSANIGLNAGLSGLMIVDFDVYKPEFAGGDLLAQLLADHPTTTADSARGGVHIIYQQPEGIQLGNKRGSLPVGVDAKGVGGYIVLAPSLLDENGRRYMWRDGLGPHQLRPQPLPAFLLETLQNERKPERKPAMHTNGATPLSPTDDYAKAKHALEFIASWRADGYDDWIAVGMALRPLGDAGLHLWDTWSSKSNKYQPDICVDKWKTFADDGKLGIGSLVHWAKLDSPNIYTNGHTSTAPEMPSWMADAPPPAPDTTIDPETGEIIPLSEKKPVSVDSADSADSADAEIKKPKQADLLAELAEERAEFFQTPEGVAIAVVKVDGHKECHKLNSGTFSDWLTNIYHERTKSIPSAQAKADAKALFSFRATKQQGEAFTRVGHYMGKIYLDLGTPEWNAVEVDANGWRIVAEPPVNFIRAKKMKPLPTPTPCTDTRLLSKYINVEPEDMPLVFAWIVAALHPRGPYPILILGGQAGSAKSTTLKVLKAIIDPTGAALQGKINDERNLFVSASNSWLLAIDNVSYVSPEMSDAYCRLSTGGGYTHRQLHTDGDEHVIDVVRPVAINGIGEIATQQDMADRAIIITPPVIPEENRRPEAEFWAEFDQDKSQVLGAVLNALSTALRELPNVKLTKLPRMADFARIGVAAEPAFHTTDANFLSLYLENREATQESIVENSKVADVLRRMMAVNTSWVGRPTELLEKLNDLAEEKERDLSWPKNAAKLTEKLQRVAPVLHRVGISAVRSRGNGKNLWTITKRHID